MKKVLIITYYWPPAGGPGVQRVLKFVKYLPLFGYQPIVLTVENGTFPAIDDSLCKDIPSNIKVYKCKTIEPFGAYKKAIGKDKDWKIPTHVHEENKPSVMNLISKWIRANLFIPDARIGWRFFAVNKGIKIVQNEKIDIIYSSSPPQSLQLIAKNIAQKTNTPWLADFRDPWTDLFTLKELPRSNFVKWIDKRLEKSVLKNANSVSTVSESLIELFKTKTNKTRFIDLPNGFDSTDIEGIEKTDSSKLTLLYMGYVDKSQVAHNFLDSISKLPVEITNQISIEFYGKCHQAMHDEIKRLNIENIIIFNDYIPHNQAIQLMKNADILLLFIPNVENNKGILTGKLFEYLATQNYILAIGPENGDAANIINNSKAGEMFDYEKDIYIHFTNLFNKWKTKLPLTEVQKDVIDKYSRKNLTKKLASEFDFLLHEKV